MLIWNLVLAKMGTYTEIETNWSFIDIMEATEIIEIKNDIEKALTPKLPKTPKTKGY